MEINEKALKDIIAKVVEETLKKKSGDDFLKEKDKSGIIKIRPSTVKCEQFNNTLAESQLCV